MRRLAFALLRLYCLDCGRVIWRWQSRCGDSHTACLHAAMVRLWQRALDTTNGPAECWTCSFCGVRP